jgi:uncharacterized protein (TIRG00374 family)
VEGDVEPGAETAKDVRASVTKRYGRFAAMALAIAVIAISFLVVLPRVADYGAVWDVVQSLSTEEIALLLLATLFDLATFGPPWMAALPGLGYWHSTVLTMSSTALSNAAPGGDALGVAAAYAMLRNWGFQAHAVQTAVAITAVWNQFINVGIPVLSVATLWLEGDSSSRLLQTAALIGVAALVAAIVVLVLVLRSDDAAFHLGERLQGWTTRLLRIVRRPPVSGWGPAWQRFRHEAVDVLRRRWIALTITQLVGHLSVFLVLLVALRAVGVDSSQVTFSEALASWSLVRLLTAVPITPGGVGIVEVGLTGALVGFGGSNDEVVAAVLIYRVLTVVPPIAIGSLLALTWRRNRPQVGVEGDG